MCIHRLMHSMEYYSAMEKNKIASFAEKNMKLEIIRLHEIIQTEKDKYYVFSCVESRFF
jgi:hypothetical protein